MGKKRNAETANKCKDTGKSRDKVRETSMRVLDCYQQVTE